MDRISQKGKIGNPIRACRVRRFRGRFWYRRCDWFQWLAARLVASFGIQKPYFPSLRRSLVWENFNHKLGNANVVHRALRYRRVFFFSCLFSCHNSSKVNLKEETIMPEKDTRSGARQPKQYVTDADRATYRKEAEMEYHKPEHRCPRFEMVFRKAGRTGQSRQSGRSVCFSRPPGNQQAYQRWKYGSGETEAKRRGKEGN